ncbi:hypothetical protein COO60DRAFT_1070127 [Scenedesmus sp. NREL 46B-D3]|nr:hypothetical protein COO60DRAFT_1070127 [Scenedesmus sp. NREL 46B-D3]
MAGSSSWYCSGLQPAGTSVSSATPGRFPASLLLLNCCFSRSRFRFSPEPPGFAPAPPPLWGLLSARVARGPHMICATDSLTAKLFNSVYVSLNHITGLALSGSLSSCLCCVCRCLSFVPLSCRSSSKASHWPFTLCNWRSPFIKVYGLSHLLAASASVHSAACLDTATYRDAVIAYASPRICHFEAMAGMAITARAILGALLISFVYQAGAQTLTSQSIGAPGADYDEYDMRGPQYQTQEDCDVNCAIGAPCLEWCACAAEKDAEGFYTCTPCAPEEMKKCADAEERDRTIRLNVARLEAKRARDALEAAQAELDASFSLAVQQGKASLAQAGSSLAATVVAQPQGCDRVVEGGVDGCKQGVRAQVAYCKNKVRSEVDKCKQNQKSAIDACKKSAG